MRSPLQARQLSLDPACSQDEESQGSFLCFFVSFLIVCEGLSQRFSVSGTFSAGVNFSAGWRPATCGTHSQLKMFQASACCAYIELLKSQDQQSA